MRLCYDHSLVDCCFCLIRLLFKSANKTKEFLFFDLRLGDSITQFTVLRLLRVNSAEWQ